ncbi:Hsp70 family protein [Chitinophaga ginsengisoli]|uniref:Molecular chaperone DnaK n=1 Tax=Chitinophaga ginsengisoli TaxID=363837 RepID=A0A2P8FRW6_9BACT|nr:Hsp70 family protein [Chitinophaga ginsengisoli]PSL24471.1 molecular chaperone DnaK [Chitinophaga ginsengisoli]
MEQMINFGVDLGTTNSAIAKFTDGKVQLFHNPADPGSYTLPSVVAFHDDRIIAGKKAKEWLEKDPQSVIGRFKRKMGTSERYDIKSIGSTKTPVELSAIILKELRTFLPQWEYPEAGVITIPASFDTIQANATKEAASLAGFRQVLLLQEPIAASLAYANMKKDTDLPDGQWLVYDLGGGTFDVALIRVREGEMKVMDHEGDNFLGGTDFDNLIVEKLLIPAITERYQFRELEQEMKSAKGKYNGKYFVLLQQAEEAKIVLSSKTSAVIVIEGLTDENNTPVDFEYTLTRAAFNELISRYVDETVRMVQQIITRNRLTAKDIQFVLMVGGSTFIPYVRQRVEDVLEIAVNCEIDPITAVAAGAAYYASGKLNELAGAEAAAVNSPVAIKVTYPKMSREKEELFLAKVTGDTSNLSYRITREDGGFDTGVKKLSERISEYLPLVQNVYNFFRLTVYDQENKIIDTGTGIIGIDSGYGISGQPIPEDICLEIDDDNHPGETKLLPVFQKNNVLPSRKGMTRVLNKTISATNGERIRINVLEGPHYALPEANKSLGYLEIAGDKLQREVLKGSDIELTFNISESRDLTVTAYLQMADQEFKQTFTPQERHTPVDVLKIDIGILAGKVENEIFEANRLEDYAVSKQLAGLKKDMDNIKEEARILADDDVTDKRYQLEDRKRKLAQAMDLATKEKRLNEVRAFYFKIKTACQERLTTIGKEQDRQHFYDIIKDEELFMASPSPTRTIEKSEALRALLLAMLWRDPEFLVNTFKQLISTRRGVSDDAALKEIEVNGRLAIQTNDWAKLTQLNHELIAGAPKEAAQDVIRKVGF